MAQADFLAGLQALGYGATEVAPGRVALPYTIESGKFAGQEAGVAVNTAIAVPGKNQL